MLKDLNTIDALTLFKLKDVGTGAFSSDEELVDFYFETRIQMEEAYAEWHNKQPVKVV